MLPAATSHFVVRIGAEPLQLFAGARGALGSTIGTAVLGGPRTAPYVRSVSTTGHTVGAVLEPGASKALFGIPGSALVENHLGVHDVLPRELGLVEERLAAVEHLDDMLSMLERFLVARVRAGTGSHPAVRLALEHFERGASVASAVERSGYSHRRFNDLFTADVGLRPKAYCRVARLERTLSHWRRSPTVALSELAIRGGYSDQAHFSREFRDFTGLTPAEYRARATPGSRHVPAEPAGQPLGSTSPSGHPRSSHGPTCRCAAASGDRSNSSTSR